MLTGNLGRTYRKSGPKNNFAELFGRKCWEIFCQPWIFAPENTSRIGFCLGDTHNTSTLDSGVARHPNPHSFRDTDVEKS